MCVGLVLKGSFGQEGITFVGKSIRKEGATTPVLIGYSFNGVFKA